MSLFRFLICASLALPLSTQATGNATAVNQAPAAQQARATQEISLLLSKTWDTPQAKVETGPVALAGRYALASWRQAGRGGRALLHYEDKHGWQVMLCAGAQIKQAPALQEAGVPAAQAQQLAHTLAQLEGRLDAAAVARFDSFEQIVRHGHNSATEHSVTHGKQ